MNISEICIKRPVFATVLSLVLVVIGLMSFHYLHTRFLPTSNVKTVFINTDYPGASATLIESSITTPIEEAISGISGIKTIRSTSSQGKSSIHIKLKPSSNVLAIAEKLRNKIAEAHDQLPPNIKQPVVESGWGWDSMELMDISFTTNTHNLKSLRDYLQRYVINKIQQIPGIANVDVDGANKYAMRIWLNPKKMEVRHISVNEIQTAIKNSNIRLPAGEIKGRSIDYPITAKTGLKTAAEFKNIMIKKSGNSIIRFKDVAHVSLGADNVNKKIVTINGKRGVDLIVQTTTDANPIQVAKQVKQLLQSVRQQLPPNIHFTVSFNQAVYMNSSVKEVYIAIGIAILCVALIMFLFLGRLRTVLIPMVTIPVCVITSFGLMYLLGFSINVITLLAIVLSIGLVVDDAIVMLENIYRHIQSGMPAFKAAIAGSREITFPVVAMTITLAAVYAPVGLIKGQAANIFQSFAYTLAGAVLISGFVALTLTPMMCSRILQFKPKKQSRYTQLLDRLFERLASGYQTLLKSVLNRRLIIIIAVVLIASGGYFLMKSIPKAFMPREDMGFIISILRTPGGANLNYTQQKINQLTNIIKQYQAVKTTVSFSNENPAMGYNMVFAELKPYAKRRMNAQKLALLVNQGIKSTPGLNAISFAPSFGGSRNSQLDFEIMTSGSYLDLYHISQALKKELSKYPGLESITSNMKFNSQQYELNVNRKLADNLNVNVKTIDTTLASFLGGTAVSTFNMQGRTYDVYIQAEQQYLHNLDSLNSLFVSNQQGQFIPLTNLIRIKPILAQQILPHYNKLRSAKIGAELAPGYKLGQVVEYLQNNLPKLLPSNTKYAFLGSAKNLLEANNNMALLFTLAIVFIYLVLSAQFESFIDPFIVLLAVPLCMVSAMAALKLVGGSLNIYTDIGLVTLIGLISKHGILITQFANQLKKQGADAKTAIIKAATIRLRPILMTTLAMIFGVLPLVLTGGASAQSRHQIGIVIISGLFFGTFFSLIVVPVTYSFASQLKGRLKRFKLATE